MRLLLFLAVIFILCITACEQDCYPATLRFGLIGFSDDEADTLILRRLTKNGSSSQQLDTFLFKQLQFYRHSDTLDLAGIPIDSYLESDYNYEVFVPGASKLFTITDIIESKETMTKTIFKCTKEACGNRILGYTINGQFTTTVRYPDLIYLQK